MSGYCILLTVAAVAFAGIANVHICYFLLHKKWECDDDFVYLSSTIASMVIVGSGATFAVEKGGELFGLGIAIAAAPIVGILWGYVVGSNLVIKFILLGLSKKLNESK